MNEVKFKRKKYDYAALIVYHGLSNAFLRYYDRHRDISFNRAARSFLRASGKVVNDPRFEIKFKVNRKTGDLEKICTDER